MGRAKYSSEARNAIMASFVTATKNIIDSEGLDAVSIRRISVSTGYSSATLYLYFDDVSELVTMSLVSYLRDYVLSVIDSTPEGDEDPLLAYRRTWTLFCEHAFAHPNEFTNLYFGPKSKNLDTIVEKYYELFPDELEHASDEMRTMLGKGTLFDRNRVVLSTSTAELGLTDHELKIANDLTISYFHHFLNIAATQCPDKEGRDDLTRQFLEGALFVLHGRLPD